MAPSRYDWKIVDWDVKPQHNQPTKAYQADKHPIELPRQIIIRILAFVLLCITELSRGGGGGGGQV